MRSLKNVQCIAFLLWESIDSCALCAVLESVTPGAALLHISKEFSECQLGGEREMETFPINLTYSPQTWELKIAPTSPARRGIKQGLDREKGGFFPVKWSLVVGFCHLKGEIPCGVKPDYAPFWTGRFNFDRARTFFPSSEDILAHNAADQVYLISFVPKNRHVWPRVHVLHRRQSLNFQNVF